MLTTLLALTSPVVAVVIAIWGFRRSNRSDRLRAFLDLEERYLSERAREGRRTIHAVIAGRTVEEVGHCSKPDLTAVGFSLAVMNSLALACECGYTDEDLVVKGMARSFLTTVEAARPYIDHVEKVRGFRPYVHAENLAVRIRSNAIAGLTM